MKIKVTEYLRHLGHYHGIPLRGISDSMLDYLVIRVINDDMVNCMSKETKIYGLYNDRGLHNFCYSDDVKNKLKELTKCQIKEHGRKVAQGRGLQTMEELTKKNLTKVGTEFGVKIKKLQKTIEIAMMTHLNLQKSMTEDEYYDYYLKNCVNVLY